MTEEQMKTARARRSGGREARKALRSAPLAEDVRPVRGGMEGGRYKPLTDAQVLRIHEAAMEALAVIGLAEAPQSGVEAMVKAGAELGDDGRLRFSKALVEDSLAKAPKEITLFGRDPRHDLHLGGKRVFCGTAGAAVHVVDVEGNTYRDSTVKDLYDAARLVDACDNIHFLQRPMVCRDIADNLEMDLNTIYACAAGTSKHIGVSFSEPGHVAAGMELIHAIAGGEEAWRARPFISNSNCFVVPPMRFATESCETMEMLIRAGMPVLLLSAGQAGATAPAPIATAIVQAVAECLAGVVYVNALSPGHPVIFGTWPFVSDLRTGAMSGGSGEQGLLSAGCAQMHHFYGLPGGAASGMADSKLPDMQSGWEQGMNTLMAGLAGMNMVYESVGMHASLLGFCLESVVLGDDMLGQMLRTVRGIDVSEDKVSIETMRTVCLEGPGHYLGQDQTLALMQSEYIYPRLADRNSPKEWEEREKPDLIKSAQARMKEIYAAHRPYIDAGTDAAIRKAFKIHLDVEAGL